VPVASFCESGDEPSCSIATVLVQFSITVILL
jgi:hypothetical protein